MKKTILFTGLTAFLLGIFETAVLSHITFLPVLPDLMLLLVIYAAVHNGTCVGVTSGFLLGLIFDFLSLAPFGLHSFIFTLIGFFFGSIYGKYNIRRIFFPCAVGFTATILKAAFLFVLRFLFGKIVQVYDMSSFLFWFEIAANTLCAPLFFALFGLFPSAFERQETAA